MAHHLVSDSSTGGHPTVTLSCPDASIEATFAPGLGMIGCSLRHHGAELLGQRGGLAAWAARGSTMGIPLLHPWANRLSGSQYAVAGCTVRLDPRSPLVHRDAHGLPMHGLVAAYPRWRVTARDAGANRARLAALLDFGADPALSAAFPFPHTLELAAELRERELSIAVTLTPTGQVSVPISFGFHPYLQLPAAPRAAWHIEAPVGRRMRLDARGIPTGESEAVAIEPGALEARAFDDLFTDLDRPARFVLGGARRRITVEFGDAYPFAQIYAPEDEAFVCFEPMTAPTNALVSGDGLATVAPGNTFRAAFSISVDELH